MKVAPILFGGIIPCLCIAGALSGCGVAGVSTSASPFPIQIDGQLLGPKDLPLTGFYGEVRTSHSRSAVKTDREGRYQAKVVQETGEAVNFRFINAIGDSSYYRHSFPPGEMHYLQIRMDHSGQLGVVDLKPDNTD